MQEQPNPETRHQFSFNGSGAEYFKIWIVNILLTVLTLYIYSAWAKVRTRRYFYGNTVLDGNPFEYHATGKQLLPGRLIGLALVLVIASGEVISFALVGAAYIFLILLTPWALCRSRAFNNKMSSYRNVRFNFTGRVGTFYYYLLLVPLIPLLLLACAAGAMYFTQLLNETTIIMLVSVGMFSIYAMFPWIQGKLAGYTINHSRFGTSNFAANISAGKFFIVYVMGVLLGLVSLAAVGALVFGIAKLAPALAGMIDFSQMASGGSGLMIAAMVAAYAVMIPVATFIRAFVQSRLRNYQFNQTSLDNKFTLSSNVPTMKLWWVEVSNLFMIVFTIGLAYPWAAVRKARLFANHTQVISKHSGDHFMSDENQKISAVGEEVGDAFDMDIAAGF